MNHITFDGPSMNVTFVRVGLQRLRVNVDPPIYVTIPRPYAVTYRDLAPGSYDFSTVGLVERVLLQGITPQNPREPPYTVYDLSVDIEPQLRASGVELSWLDDFGNPVPQNFELRSEGAFSSAITSSGWTSITTPSFNTRTITRIGETVAFDVNVPSEQANPYSIGDVQLLVNIPSAGIYNEWLGYQSLDSLPQDDWSTVEFALPPAVIEALTGEHPDAEFVLTSNLASDAQPLLIDHLRFDGELTILPRCGDGHVIGDEECDDGNLEDGDGCSGVCSLETEDVCGLHNAVDIGSVNSVNDLPGNACVKVSQYPGDWVNALQLQRHAGLAPISFVWSNCLGAGSGTLEFDWQQQELRTVSSLCETLIEFMGSSGETLRMSWWADG